MGQYLSKAIIRQDQINTFNSSKGYLDLNNDDLAHTIISWNLGDPKNLSNMTIISRYVPWSNSVSFLYMINAWQWFFSGVLLSRQTYLPAQALQMWYYSIFFSSMSFLSSQFRGVYTIAIQEAKDANPLNRIKSRKAVWLDHSNQTGTTLELDAPVHKGGQHETIADWFYAVFQGWDSKGSYPDVVAFIKERKYHTHFRNLYTYSLADIAEEVFSADNELHIDNSSISALWNRDQSAVDIFPEAFWAIEHLRIVTDLHLDFINAADSKPAVKDAQCRLINGIYRLHQKTGLNMIIDIVLKGVTSVCKKPVQDLVIK